MRLMCTHKGAVLLPHVVATCALVVCAFLYSRTRANELGRVRITESNWSCVTKKEIHWIACRFGWEYWITFWSFLFVRCAVNSAFTETWRPGTSLLERNMSLRSPTLVSLEMFTRATCTWRQQMQVFYLSSGWHWNLCLTGFTQKKAMCKYFFLLCKGNWCHINADSSKKIESVFGENEQSLASDEISLKFRRNFENLYSTLRNSLTNICWTWRNLVRNFPLNFTENSIR